uniref:HMG box domain-containing protein n=1 Tax=Globisporangium ultimum (strain ATCC 200006 / CBS 805.95 / DAOM BR144) TaxID=431595 RepID=K3WLA0_GLOUD
MSGRDFAHLQPDNAEVERAILSQEVEALRNRIGLRQVDVSKECGVNASMLSQWMLGRYKGNVSRINGLMESWLIRRRGGKPMEKGSMSMQLMGPPGSSPKVLKRRLDDTNGSLAGTKKISDAVLAQRKLYDYPKNPPSDTLLIPIRLDVDVEGYRYIDSFSWNVHEKDYTYETFAATLVRDLNLPESFRKRIASQIEAQVEKGKRSMPWHEAVTSESLHPIYINIRINDTILIDRFEWDLSNPSNSPEQFAQVLCEELGLSGEFEAQVALAIREQLRDYSRLIKEGLRDRVTRLPPVTIALRDRTDVSSWEPSVRYILAEDIALLEREDFKRMRAHSQSTIVATPPPAPVIKPNRPPKPVNTFLMFCREWRKKIMTDNVNTSAKDASKILGEMWQKLSDQERAKYIPMTEKENERRLKEWQLKESLAATGATPATAAATGAVAAVALGTRMATDAASAALSTPIPLATTLAASTATILAPNGAVAPSAVPVGTAISTSAVPTSDDIALDEDEEEQEEEEEEEEEEQEEEEEEEEEEIDDDVGEDIDTDGDIPIDVDMILDGVDLHLDL